MTAEPHHNSHFQPLHMMVALPGSTFCAAFPKRNNNQKVKADALVSHSGEADSANNLTCLNRAADSSCEGTAWFSSSVNHELSPQIPERQLPQLTRGHRQRVCA